MSVAQEIVDLALNGKPTEMGLKMDDVVTEKIAALVDARKTELAKTMFADKEPENE